MFGIMRSVAFSFSQESVYWLDNFTSRRRLHVVCGAPLASGLTAPQIAMYVCVLASEDKETPRIVRNVFSFIHFFNVYIYLFLPIHIKLILYSTVYLF